MLAIGYERDVSCRIRLGTNLGSKLWDGGPSPERDLQRSGRGGFGVYPIESGVFLSVVSSWFPVFSWVLDEALKNSEGVANLDSKLWDD